MSCCTLWFLDHCFLLITLKFILERWQSGIQGTASKGWKESTERSLSLQSCWSESSSGSGLAKITAVWWLLGALHSTSTNESVSTSHKPLNNWCYCSWESSGSTSGKGRDLNERGKWAALFPAPSGHLWDTSVWGNLEEIRSLVAPFWR